MLACFLCSWIAVTSSFSTIVLQLQCRSFNLGLATKAKGLQRCGPRLSPEVAFSCPEVQKSVRERTLTLPSKLPCWELESRWTPECSESDCKGQNSMAWGFFYTIEKLLKCRCLKWACITHLVIWNTSYGQKKGRESNLGVWLPTTKSQESTWLPYVQVMCDIPLKRFRWGLQLCFRSHLNRRSAHKVMGTPKLWES